MLCKRKRKKAKILEFMHRDKTSVKNEMYDYTGNKWSHRNSNKRFEEKFGSHSGKAFNRFTTKDSYTRNVTHNMESGNEYQVYFLGVKAADA
jgi:hypothetical protein